MKLTSKARYAVMAVADLALYNYLDKNTVVLKDIAERQDISISYLEQLFGKLRKKGIVNSIRGPGGGYYLARDFTNVSVWEIITAVDETIELSRCSGKGNCTYGSRCITHNLWFELTEAITDHLKKTTIAKIIQDHLSDENIGEEIYKRLETYTLEQKVRRNYFVPNLVPKEGHGFEKRSSIDIVNVEEDSSSPRRRKARKPIRRTAFDPHHDY